MYPEIYTALTVKYVIRALGEMERNLVSQQRRWHHSKPLITCPRLAINHGYERLNVMERLNLPDFTPDPNRPNAFEFYIGYNPAESRLAWTVDISREEEKTCISVALSDQSKDSGDVELFYRKFLKLLNAWADQHPPATNLLKSGKDVPKRQLLKSNKWLIDQVFNHGNTDLRQLHDEWLCRRQEDDCKEPPVAPLRSMGTVISEEKKRRKRAAQ